MLWHDFRHLYLNTTYCIEYYIYYKTLLISKISSKHLKGQFTQKWKFCHDLLTQCFQTCINVFILLNTKEDILKNGGNRAVLGHQYFSSSMEVNGAPKQPGYKLSSKYLPLCSAEQRHSYRLGNTGRVNDRIVIFGWNIKYAKFVYRGCIYQGSSATNLVACATLFLKGATKINLRSHWCDQPFEKKIK